MKRTYSLFQEYIAFVLLISFFLQSCGGGFDNNPLIPTREKQPAHITTHTQEIICQTNIHPLFDQTVIAQGGHAVTFYEETNGEIKASVEVVDEKDKVFNGVPVEVQEGIDLASLPLLPKKIQQTRIYIQLTQGSQPAKVFIYKGAGLAGGGNSGSKAKRGKANNKGNEEEKDIDITEVVIKSKAKGKKRNEFIEIDRNKPQMVPTCTEKGKEKWDEELDSEDEEEKVACQTPCTAYYQALEDLQTNNPQVSIINLSQEELNREQFEVLKKAVDSNFTVGYIQWGELPSDCQELKNQIEDKLAQNICNYTYHPNDYVHGLLASHIYKEPKKGDKIDLRAVSQQLGHNFPPNRESSWKVIRVIDDTRDSGYYSALYVNEATHQAVLAFQGTDLENKIIKDLVIEDMQGVLGNAITKQQTLAYKATKEAVNYINQRGFNLSMTGHSLGGYLAELSVYHSLYDFNYKEVEGIVFDSPGINKKLDSFKSNIKNRNTKLNKLALPITTYLSAPNLVNACHKHVGEAYRVYPQLKWSDWKEKWVRRAGNLPMIGDSVQAKSKGFLTLSGHSLDIILSLFDPMTGKPKKYVRIHDWPRINADATRYIGKKKVLSSKIGSTIGGMVGGTIGGIVGSGLGDLADPYIGNFSAVGSLITVLADCLNADLEQYWTTLEHLDEDYKERNLTTEEKFKQKYVGHYRPSTLKLSEHVLHKDKFKSVDWYLYKLDKYRHQLENKHQRSNISLKVLRNILADYRVVSINHHPYIQLSPDKHCIETLRHKMQRALAILSSSGQREDIEADIIRTLNKQIEPRLHEYKLAGKLPDYAIARENKQEELRTHLEQTGICTIYGPGGMGKSTLVAQYKPSLGQEQVIRWIEAETQEKLLTGYQELAKELGISYQELAQQFKQEPNRYLIELTRKVYNALKDRKQPVLLILDNAEESALVDSCLSNRPSLVQVIITTRNKKGFNKPKYNPVELNAFTPEEGKAYIQQRLETLQPSDKDIQALINEVSLIPQKLDLATSYIHEISVMKVEDYIKKLQELKKQGKKQQGKLILPEARLGLETLNASSQLVMRYGAYLDSDFIPFSLINGLLEISDEEELGGILSSLEKLSLITIINSREKQGIQIHRNVQQECIEYQGWESEHNISHKKLLSSLMEVLVDCMPILEDASDIDWQKGQLYPHVNALLKNTEEEVSHERGILLAWMGDYNYSIAINYKQALTYHEQALVIGETIFKRATPFVASLLVNIGLSYNRLGEYQQALKYLEKALEMQIKINTSNHPSVANVLNNLGNVHNNLNNHQEALRCYQEALTIRKDIHSSGDSSIAAIAAIAASLGSIGDTYYHLGDYKEALECHESALAMQKNTLPDHHPDIAHSLHNMGKVYSNLKEYSKSLEHYEKALAIYRAVYIGNHPYIANLLHNIGNVYANLDEHQQALKYYKEALAMDKAIYTEAHPSIAQSLYTIALVYNRLGEYREVLEYLEQALDMYQNIFPEGNPLIDKLQMEILKIRSRQSSQRLFQCLKAQLLAEANHPN